MNTATNQVAKTAHDTYTARKVEALGLIGQLEVALRNHAKREAGDTRNWGYSGDLGLLNRLLAEAVQAVGGAA